MFVRYLIGNFLEIHYFHDKKKVMRIILSIMLLLGVISLMKAQIIFLDQSQNLGHTNTRSGKPIGVADINNDGLDDIIRLHNTNELQIDFQNGVSANFTPYTHGALTGEHWAISVADVDNDGFNDIFTGGHNFGLKLLKPQIPSTGFQLETISQLPIFLQNANFADIDNDGDLDIFASNATGLSQVYENEDGDFEYNINLLNAVSTVASDNSGNHGSVWTDFDNDGDLDVYISKNKTGITDINDGRRRNLLFENDGFGNYNDVAAQVGLLPLAQSWAADFGDIDNDGDLDCFIINHDQQNGLYLNSGNGTFTNITANTALYPIMNDYPMGLQVKFVDFDNDSYLDILYTTFDQGAALFKNNGDNTFTIQPNALPLALDMHSFSVGDLDNDGYIDIITGFGSGANTPSLSITDKLYINGGNGNNYFKVRLDGQVSNPNGLGARVEVYDQFTGTQIREIRSGESCGITSSLTAHFGMASSPFVDSVIVRWPSGVVDKIDFPTINQLHTIVEGQNCQIEVDFSSQVNGTMVDFIEESTVGATNWTWNFGDGNTSTEQNPTHTYAQTGVYTVCLTATGVCGQAQICKTVNVSCLAPTAEHVVTNINDLMVSFQSTSTGVIDQAVWDFGDGTTSTILNPTHNFPEAGQYNVCLEVSNACGFSQYCETVNVGCFQTQVGFEFSATNLDVQFTDLSSNDVFAWLWDFGDGTTSTLQNPAHTYSQEGTYNVCLNVTGVCGQRSLCLDVMIDCNNPIPTFSSFVDELEVTFQSNIIGEYSTVYWDFGDGNTSSNLNPSHTYDLPGEYNVCLEVDGPCGVGMTCNTVVTNCEAPNVAMNYVDNGSLNVDFQGQASSSTGISWMWNFGDGITSNLQSPNHQYASPGVYTVTLTIESDCGSNSTSTQVTVNCDAPLSTFSTSVANLGVTFFPTVNSASSTYAWDFGDGNTANQATVQHNYASPGQYEVCLTVTSICGESTTCETIDVGCEDPVANFTYMSDGLDVSFVYSGPSSPLTYFWMFGDGQTSNEANPSVTYSSASGYQVCLTVTDVCGTDQYCETISVGCEPPAAFFAVQQNGLEVITFNTSSGGATNWNWDFGDGNTSIEQNPVHVYNAPGTYNICMSAGNTCGQTQHCQEVIVTCAEPQAAFSYEVDNLVVDFTDLSTGGVTSYTWTFGDGTPSSFVTNPTHTYTQSGQYQVCLVVSSVCGNTQICETIAVGCESTTPDFDFVANELVVDFTDLSAGDPIEWTWLFGDGNSSTTQHPTHTYAAPGTYTVCLESGNNCGNNQICKEVTVDCALPTASFEIDETNLTVILTDLSMNNPMAWSWTFGDGNTSAIQNPTHNYAEAGEYTICLEVTNNCGSAMDCQTVDLTCLAPQSLFSVDGTGTTLIFNDQSTNDPTSWLWDFGDGTTSTLQDPEHTYAEATSYDVCLTVTNDCGEDTNCLNILVTSTNEISIVESIKLMPNPAQYNVSLVFNSQINTNMTIAVTAVNGQQILSQPYLVQQGENTINWDVSTWSPGVYWVRLSHEESTTVRPLIVVE